MPNSTTKHKNEMPVVPADLRGPKHKTSEWREYLRNKGFGNQAVIIGTKRCEFFDEIQSLLASQAQSLLEEIERDVIGGREDMFSELNSKQPFGEIAAKNNLRTEQRTKLSQIKERVQGKE